MTRIFAIVFSAIIPFAALAEDSPEPDTSALIRPVGDSDLSEFLWTNRPIVLFADTPADPRYSEQLERLSAEIDRLAERDVVVLTDTDPAAKSPARLKLRPRGFMLAIIGKNGDVIIRKPLPWTVREITRTIDKMPMRQREIDERRGEG